MKKKLSLLLAAALALTSIGATTVMADSDPEKTYYYKEDYQGDFVTNYSFYDCWDHDVNGLTTKTGAVKKVKDPTNPNGDNYVMNLYSVDASGNSQIQGVRDGSIYNTTAYLYNGADVTKGTKLSELTPGKVVVMKTRFLAKSTIFDYFTKSFYILPANTRSSMDRYAGINTEWNYGFRKGRNCINVAGNVVNNVTIAYDEWHEVCYIYDVSTGAAQYYIDGTLIPIVHNTEPILECGLKIFYPGDTKTAKEKNLLPEDILYIDDTEIYSYTPAVNAKTAFSAAAESFTVTTETTMTAADISNVLVTKNGVSIDASELVNAPVLSEDGKTLTITFKDLSELGKANYTLAIAGITDCYDQVVSTAPYELTLPEPGANVEFSAAEGIVKITFKTKVTEISSENIVIKKDGAAVENAVSDVVLSENGDYVTFTVATNDIGAKTTTVELSNVTDSMGQAVNINGDNILRPAATNLVTVTANLNTLTLTFDNEIQSITASDFIVKDSNGTIVENAVISAVIDETDAKTVTVGFGAPVIFGNEYTIAVNGGADKYSSKIVTADNAFNFALTKDFYFDDFSEFNANEFDNWEGWGNNDGTKGYHVQATDPLDENNKVMNVYGEGKTSTSYPNGSSVPLSKKTLSTDLNKFIKQGNDTVVVYETKIYFDEDVLNWVGNAGNNGISIEPQWVSTASSSYNLQWNTNIGKLNGKLAYRSVQGTTVDLNTNAWNDLRYVVDYNTNYGAYWVNGQLLAEVQPFNDFGNKQSVGLVITDAKHLIPKNQIYVDDVKVYAVTKDAAVADISCNNVAQTITVKFGTPMNEESLAKIFFKDSEGALVDNAVANAVLSEDGYTAVFTLNDVFTLGDTYDICFYTMYDKFGQKIEVEDGTYKYTAAKSKSVYVVDGSIIRSGNDVSLTLNTNVPDAGAWLAVGFYDKYNALVASGSKNITVSTETQETITVDGNTAEAVRYGIFLWDGIDTMVPLQRAEIVPISK